MEISLTIRFEAVARHLRLEARLFGQGSFIVGWFCRTQPSCRGEWRVL